MGTSQDSDSKGPYGIQKFLFVLFVSIFISGFAEAQETRVKEDSTLLYKNIETYSKRSKFNTFIFQQIFKPVTQVSKKKRVYKKLIQKPYSTFEGKIIRNINIFTLDPFGYSVNDTLVATQNFLRKAGNTMHFKTRGIAIRNLLLFSKNKPFNSLNVKESERLIRNQKFVHEVSFYVTSVGKGNDSVDVLIRESDKWSIIPDGSISNSGISADVIDKNFLGTGHEFRNVFTRNLTKGINAYNTDYSIPNIKNTYINFKLHYGIESNDNFKRSIAIDRPFYSPFAKWAAGVSFSSQLKKDSLKYISPDSVPMYMRFGSQDYWAGKAIRVFKGNMEDDRATNLILAARYFRIRHTERPNELYDPLNIYSSEDFYLAGIGISTRKYVQDKYIFKYGVIEDVPVGKVYGMAVGYQVKDNSERLYFGMRFSFGNYNEWGYLSSNFEYGTFFRSSHTEQGVITAGINYFTGLFEAGKWKFRQFAKPQITIGLNRFEYDSLTINDGYGLDGFNSTSLSGTKRLLFTLQTQSYSPLSFIGFRFGPFLTYTMGMLADPVTGFKNSKAYSQLGFGVLIKNENLVFSSFQFSIAFYPDIPGIGQNIMKMNSFKTSDMGFRDFEIGKPSPVIYR